LSNQKIVVKAQYYSKIKHKILQNKLDLLMKLLKKIRGNEKSRTHSYVPSHSHFSDGADYYAVPIALF
jgi:hypothetical protein